MRKGFQQIWILALCAVAWFPAGQAGAGDPNLAIKTPRALKAAIIPCRGAIDPALFYSIKRRTGIALAEGAEYLVYQISTYGGRVDAADDIAKYLIQDVASRGHTVAYVATEAISAGALVSVSCKDVIMQENTTIGDAAPITMGEKLEGVEREKAESFIRAIFQRAAEANGYPELLLKAMVTVRIEVYRVKNLQTGRYEFFERDDLPTDANHYDVKGIQKINGDDELLTLTASQAYEYGIARAVVRDVNEALAFLADRDNVRFVGPPILLEPNWSEHLVSWLNSPAVMGILVMVALLGVYMEFSAPGFGLPGIVAIVCFALMLGSKYLVGMANWVEIVILLLGIVLLLVELFVLPGFGVAGILGIVLVFSGLFGMLIRNGPDEFPWPQTAADWGALSSGILSVTLGFLGFVVLAWVLSRYLPKFSFMSGLILAPAVPGRGDGSQISMTVPPETANRYQLHVKDVGTTIMPLRPAGKARFDEAIVDVVADGEFLDKNTKVRIIAIQGSRVVVRRFDTDGPA
ncbi:MAG: hypothetical protein KBI32_12180 [Phycisphaerae bacterium]|nr:hypothetical protein [Phycisphaerae bacterium]